MSLYLILNILIIIFPLSLSFEKKIKYYTKMLPLFGSVIIVSTIFILWDAMAVSRGDWGFSNNYTSGFRIYNLPIEEILFFITVPFSTIFIYETINLYLPDKNIYYNKYIYSLVLLVLIIMGFIHSDKYYTSTVFLFTALFLSITMFWFKELLRSRNYWLFVLIVYVPFMIFNYLLTSLPVVWYSSKAIIGLRIITIPIEDFFYCFTLISAYLLVYLGYKRKWQKKKELL